MSAKRETDDHPGADSSQREPLRLFQRKRPEIVAGQDFLRKELPPLKQIVPGLLPEGAIILAGAPKAGKSRLALSLAVAVATGDPALGKIPVRRRDVLYLCLEDGERMTQDRLRALKDEDPGSLFMSFEWPTLKSGCESEIEDWLDGHPNAGLVVVDTLQRIRPQGTAYKTLYEMDYASCAPFADLAHKRGVCVLIVHHTRKARPEDAGDPMEKVSGTTGLTGSVDGWLILVRKRNSRDGSLELSHRGMGDTKYSITTDDETGIWTLVGEAPEAEEDDEATDALGTPEQRRYVELLRERGPMRPKQIAEALDKEEDAVRHMVRKLAKRGLLQTSGGEYWVPEPTPASGNGIEPKDSEPEPEVAPAHPVHGVYSVHAPSGIHGDHGVHPVHSVHSPGYEESEQSEHHERMNTPLPGIRAESHDGSPIAGTSEPEHRTANAVPARAEPASEREPGRRTPTSDVPFKRRWRDPCDMPWGEPDHCSERIPTASLRLTR